MLYKILWLFLSCIFIATAQENAGTSIASALQMCYNQTTYLKYNLPPTHINILIELIRKIENGKNSQDARKLSYELIHRFRQDGIQKNQDLANNPYIIAYSPIGFQRFKNEVILKSLIPGDALQFDNDTLTSSEQCALHFMLSNTIITHKRGDEAYSCTTIGRYVQRTKRETEVEVIATPQQRTNFEDLKSEQSQCPMEFGAVRTNWGAVQAGTLLAGIAVGFMPVRIPYQDKYIDNALAVTITGDVAEAALYQASTEIKIGNSGSWNSTLAPRYYFIEKDDDRKYQFTDAELRAGLDGYILAKEIDKTIKQKYSNIKISQILDMYYSRRGVFSKNIRACNRKTMYPNELGADEIETQAVLFAKYFEKSVQLRYSPTPENVEVFTKAAIKKFTEYLGQLSDLDCIVDNEPTQRAFTDLIVVVDVNWRFPMIQPTLGYLLNEIDLNKFGSNVTIINGNDGRVILNSTNSVSDFYNTFNLTNYQNHPAGFRFPDVIAKIEEIVKYKMNEDKLKNIIGGKSTIVLLVPQSEPTTSDNTYINDRKEYFKNYLPDVKTLVLGQSSLDSYKALVGSQLDIFTINDNSNENEIRGVINKVISRIKEIPVTIRNSQCGDSLSGDSESKSIDQYVEPDTTNYYKISPQYFYGDGDRFIKIRGQGYGQLQVCWSRESLGRDNVKNKGTCKNINSDEYSISLSNTCNLKEAVTNCPPVYISVTANVTANALIKCNDKNCRFPDNIKYTISTESFVCKAGSMQYVANITLITLIMTMLIKLNIL